MTGTSLLARLSTDMDNPKELAQLIKTQAENADVYDNVKIHERQTEITVTGYTKFRDEEQ